MRLGLDNFEAVREWGRKAAVEHGPVDPFAGGGAIDVGTLVVHFDANSLLLVAAVVGTGGGVYSSVKYLLKKTVDMGFDIATQRIKGRLKPPVPPVELYDPYGRLVKK